MALSQAAQEFKAMEAIARRMRVIAARRFAHDLRHTVQGKFALVFVVAAPFLMKGVISSSIRLGPGLSAEAVTGVLFIAHVAAFASFVLAVASLLARQLIVARVEEPLLAFPYAHSALAGYQVAVSTIAGAALYALSFFYLFFGVLLARTMPRPVLSLPLHILSHVALFFVVGLAVHRAFLRFVLGPRAIARGRRVHFVAGAGSLLAFVGLPVLPQLLLGHQRAVVESIGQTAGAALHALHPAFAAALAAGQLDIGVVAIWSVAFLVACVWALRAFRLWMHRPHRELTGDFAQPGPRYFASLIATGAARRGWLRDFHLFWAKDVRAHARDRAGYLATQWLLLGAVLGLISCAWALHARGAISTNAFELCILLATLVAPAVLAFLRGLNALGSEGRQLLLLLPVRSPAELFVHKALVNAIYVSAHSLLYALVVGAAASMVGMQPYSISTLAVLATGCGFVLAFAATSLGFLLPDFERRAAFLPGSTGLAKAVFAGEAIYLAGVLAASHYLIAIGVFPVSMRVSIWLAAVLLCVFVSSLLAWWAVHRTARLEL